MRSNPLPVLVALIVLAVLHNDFWLWYDGNRVLGLPVGLTYHVAYCLAVSAVFWWIVRSSGRAARRAGGAGSGPSVSGHGETRP